MKEFIKNMLGKFGLLKAQREAKRAVRRAKAIREMYTLEERCGDLWIVCNDYPIYRIDPLSTIEEAVEQLDEIREHALSYYDITADISTECLSRPQKYP